VLKLRAGLVCVGLSMRRVVLGGAAALLLLHAGRAPAQTPSTDYDPAYRPSVITMPDWLRRPTGDELEHFYPRVASQLEIQGSARIACVVDGDGGLFACEVQAEQPTGLGFGAAAVRMAPIFRMRPMTRDGSPVAGGRITIPIAFRLPRPPAPAAPPRIEAAALADARRVVAVAHGDGMAEQMMAQPLGEIDDGVTPPETQAAALSAARDALADLAGEVRDLPAEALAVVFSPAELKAMAAQAAQGDVAAVRAGIGGHLAELDAAVAQVGEPVFRRMQHQAREDFCRARDCGPPADAAGAARR
jgi:TonB family protein